jgi:FkbM family methyltransferase
MPRGRLAAVRLVELGTKCLGYIAAVRQRLAELRYRRLLRRLAGPRLLAAFAALYEDAFFIEIGANDGDQHDHLSTIIRSHRWRGVMLEPVPYVFERLRQNYGLVDGVVLENLAIADQEGTLPFWHLRQAADTERDQLPEWYDGIGSFNRDIVIRHARGIPDIEDRLVRTDVVCLTFESLLRRHGVTQVDLIVVDTEGYDWEVIRTIDLAACSPRLLIYEHFHLSDSDRAECRSHLEQAGYATMEEGFDTFCLDIRPEDSLSDLWRRTKPAVAGVSVHDAQAV